MPLILGRSGTQCVAMVTKLLSSYLEHIYKNLTVKSQTFLIQIC